MATLSSANTKYTAEQLTKATGISAETLATWGLTEATDTLTMSQLAEIASSDAQAKKVLEKIVAQNAQAVASGKVVASNASLVASETSATLATGSFTTAIKANIAAMWTWMTTTPLGWLTLLAAGIFAAVKAYDALTVSAEEASDKIEESRSAYEETTSTIESMNSELETTKKRIEELEAKDALSFTDKAELDNLREQNAELERSISLLDKKRQNEAKQTVVDIKQNQETLDEDFDKSIKNLSEYKKEYEETRQLGIKGMAQGAVTLENYEATMAAMDKTMGQYESSVLDNIEKYEQYKEDIINKYGTNDISTFSQSDRALYNDIVSQLQAAYKEIYTNSEYNKFVIEPIFNQEDLKGLQDELIEYFINGGYTDLSSLEEKFGSDIITALRNACERAGIDFDKMIGDIYNNSQSKLNQIAPIVTAPTGAYDAKQNSISKQIRDYIQNDLPEEDRTILLNAEIPDDVKFRTKQDVDNYIASLKADVDTNETDILSFSDAWEKLKNSTEDATKGLADNLIELAESGKLTAEALSKADTSEFFKKSGISAEEATRQINALVSASTQLQSMSAQISKMSDMLADKKNGTVASASDLAGFDATVQGLESWEEFERVMGSSKSSMEECQAAANALATEWVNNGNYLANLTEENKDYYIQQLKTMGVENAASVVTESLTGKKEALRLKYLALNAVLTDFEGKTNGACARLLEQENASDQTRAALADLVTQEILFNNSSLDVSGKISALNQLALAAYGVSDALTSGMGLDSRYYNGKTTEERAAEKMSILSSSQKVVASQVTISPTGSGNYKPSGGSGGSGGSGSSSDTKQTIDWIERKISSLNDNIDLTQSKIDNLFNIKTPKGLSKQITDVSNKLKKASDNTDKWKSKLSKIKIPDSVKKLIQGGKDVNLSKYSKTEQKNIKKYQSTWKSYSSAKKKENSLYNQKWDLQTQKGKEALLKSQEKDYNTLAKIEEKAYKKYMSKAKSVKLSSSLKKKVQSGDYKISDYSSKTQSLIQEYQDWWDKAQDANKGKYEAKKNAKDKRIERYQLYVDDAEAKIAKSQALAALDEGNYKNQNKHLEGQKKYYEESYAAQIKIAEEEKDAFKVTQLRAELAQKLRGIEKEEFDNVVSTYEYKIGHIKNQLDDITNAISDVENRGLIADSTFYTAQIDVQNKIKNQLETEHQKLKEQLKDIEDFTPAWYNALNSIQDVENEIANTNSAIKELQNSINGVANTLSGNILDSFQDLNSEADTLITLLGDNLSDDKLGNLTSDGIAALGLYSQQMNVSKASAERVQNEINSIQKAINNGTYGNFVDSNGMLRTFASTYEAEDRIKELYSTYRSEIQNTYQYESKIVDLMKQKYQSELNYVKELIEQKKELLSAEQDLYQYSRDIKNQVDGINSIKKQLASLQGDTSIENKARVQKLEKQLKDQEEELQNKQYERYISDTQNMLDTLSNEYSELIESVSKNRDTLLKEGNQLISANGAEIRQTINETASEYGMQLTDNMQSATANITTGLSGIKTVLDTIAQHVAGRIVDTDGETHDVNAGGAKNDAISKLLSSGTNTKPSSKLTKAIGEAYGVGLNLQQIADLSRLLGLNYELKDFTNESPIHNQAKLDILNELEERKYLKKSGNSYIRGYAGGGVISSVANAIRLNGDKVLISGKPGERMLTEKQNENFEKFTDALPNLVNLTDIIKPNVNVPTAIDRNIGGVTYGGNNQFVIEVNGVANYDEFMQRMQSDPRAEQLVQSYTGRLLNKNASRLSKYNIKFK